MSQNPAGASGPGDETAFYEILAMTDLYNRMINQCFRKCVVNFSQPDLFDGEKVCLDRCVVKYVDAQKKVGGVLSPNGPVAPN